MTWVVEIPKYKYGYGFQKETEKHYFETQVEANAFADKLHAYKQVYEV